MMYTYYVRTPISSRIQTYLHTRIQTCMHTNMQMLAPLCMYSMHAWILWFSSVDRFLVQWCHVCCTCTCTCTASLLSRSGIFPAKESSDGSVPRDPRGVLGLAASPGFQGGAHLELSAATREQLHLLVPPASSEDANQGPLVQLVQQYAQVREGVVSPGRKRKDPLGHVVGFHVQG